MKQHENKNLIQQTVIETISLLGIAHPELSFSKAKSTYGKIFVDLVRYGRIRPRRVGEGKNGPHYYSVADIVSAIEKEEAKAKLL